MVGIVLVSHSRALAVAVKEFVMAMAGPKLPLALAAGAGDDHSELGTNGVEIMEAIGAVMSEEGVLVLMDIGSALLSTDMALELLEEGQRARVRCAAAPFVEGAIAAGVVAALGSSLEEVAREATGALRQKLEHLGGGEIAAVSTSSGEEGGQSVRVVVPNPHGLHARPAARFIREANGFGAEITVRNLANGRGPASAKSLTGLASLEVLRGHEIEISARGADAEAALRTLKRAVEGGFGDSLEALPEPAMAAAQYAGAPIGISSGIALGPLHSARRAEMIVPTSTVDDPALEERKLRAALDQAKAELRKGSGRKETDIFEAQAMLLEDPALLSAAEAGIRERRENAALAWSHAYQAAADGYARMENEYLRQRAADVRDIGARVLEALGIARPRVGDLAEPGLLAVDDLAPAEVTALPATVLGVILLEGGRTSHASILLRARGLPAIAQAHAALADAAPGTQVAFDGETGELWIAPAPEKLEELRAQMDAQRRAAGEAARLSHEPAITSDGHEIVIFANLGRAAEAAEALARGAAGVGLFRTEFLFLGRAAAPAEDEQFAALCQLRETMVARPVVIRTLDIGGDKEAPYLGLPREANPFLGERGLRLCLARPALFHPHLRAILRAGLGGDFRIMFPMVTELAELRAARAALEEAHRTLAAAGIPHAWPVPTGIMVEVPSAAILADQLAAEADFFSIGTNDLTQYLLAADRGHPALARFQDALHPTVLRTIARLTAEAHRQGKHVAVCGEAASDPIAARLLVGLGVDELSLTPAQIPAIKSVLRATSKNELEALASRALAMESAEDVRGLFPLAPR